MVVSSAGIAHCAGRKSKQASARRDARRVEGGEVHLVSKHSIHAVRSGNGERGVERAPLLSLGLNRGGGCSSSRLVWGAVCVWSSVYEGCRLKNAVGLFVPAVGGLL